MWNLLVQELLLILQEMREIEIKRRIERDQSSELH